MTETRSRLMKYIGYALTVGSVLVAFASIWMAVACFLVGGVLVLVSARQRVR